MLLDHILKSKDTIKPERAFDVRRNIGKFLQMQGIASITPGVLLAGGGIFALTTANATIGAVGSGGHTVMRAAMSPITGVAKTAIGAGVAMAVVGTAEIALGGTFEDYAEQRSNKYNGLEKMITDTVKKTIANETKYSSKNTATDVAYLLEGDIARIVNREVKNAYGRKLHIESKGESIEVTDNKEHKAAPRKRPKSHYKIKPRDNKRS